MAEKNGVYYCPKVGERVAWAPWLEFLPSDWIRWGLGPFEVISVDIPTGECTCGVAGLNNFRIQHDHDCGIFKRVEALTIKTQIGEQKVSGYWFEFHPELPIAANL